LDIPDRSLLGFGATLGRPRSIATGLAGTVARYFSIPTRGVPFQGRWHALSPDLWTRLTARPQPRTRPAGLGGDLVLGTRAWDQAATFELKLGPMDLPSFLSFLPGDARRRIPDGERLAPLRSLVRLQTPLGVEIRGRLILIAAEAPRLPLTSHPKGPRLGYTAWLGTPPGDRPLDHVTLPLG
jgi:type VI secretion system protein ImpH